MSDGEEGDLVGSERRSYWKENAPGGERHLQPLGLRPVAPPAASLDKGAGPARPAGPAR